MVNQVVIADVDPEQPISRASKPPNSGLKKRDVQVTDSRFVLAAGSCGPNRT
jgi:hypothetical protein